MILCYMLPNGAASFTLCITYRSRSWRTRLFFPASRFSSLFLDALSRYLSLEIVFKGILFDPKEARNWFCFFFFCRHADIGKERRVGQFWLFATKVWTRIKMAHRIARASRKMPRSVCKEFDGARRGLLFLSLFYYFSFFFLFLWSFCAAWVCRRRLRWFLKDTCQRRWNVPPDGKTNVKRSHYRRPSFDIETFFFEKRRCCYDADSLVVYWWRHVRLFRVLFTQTDVVHGRIEICMLQFVKVRISKCGSRERYGFSNRSQRVFICFFSTSFRKKEKKKPKDKYPKSKRSSGWTGAAMRATFSTLTDVGRIIFRWWIIIVVLYLFVVDVFFFFFVSKLGKGNLLLSHRMFPPTVGHHQLKPITTAGFFFPLRFSS